MFDGSGIGMVENRNKCSEEVRWGVSSLVDACLGRININMAKRLQGFELKNKGRGNVTYTLKKRGVSYNIPAENLAALKIGATSQYKGAMAQRRITPGSMIIVDVNVGTPQQIEDSNSDGILYQTNGPAGPVYPVEVGTIDYIEGLIDFTFAIAVTPAVTVNYNHTNWTDFGTPITSDIVAGGGGIRTDVKGVALAVAENFVDGIKDEEEVGFFAKRTAADQARTELGAILWYFGNSEEFTLPPIKGEIDGYPYHNA